MMPPAETRAFAHRVRLNLDAIDAIVVGAPAKAHQVTQLVLTLLGLLVLPNETYYLSAAGDKPLSELAAQGWPMWTIAHDLSRRPEGTPDTLADLLWHLRSVVASGQVRMTAGEKPLDAVSIYFDQQVADRNIATWSASITAPGLRTFCERLIELIARED